MRTHIQAYSAARRVYSPTQARARTHTHGVATCRCLSPARAVWAQPPRTPRAVFVYNVVGRGRGGRRERRGVGGGRGDGARGRALLRRVHVPKQLQDAPAAGLLFHSFRAQEVNGSERERFAFERGLCRVPVCARSSVMRSVCSGRIDFEIGLNHLNSQHSTGDKCINNKKN